MEIGQINQNGQKVVAKTAQQNLYRCRISCYPT